MKDRVLQWVVILGFAIQLAVPSALAGEEWTTSKSPEQGYVIDHPMDWQIERNVRSNLIGVFDLTVICVDIYKNKTMEVWVHILANPEKKPVGSYLTSGKMNGKEFIKRSEVPINGLAAVIVGFESDPPAWGILKYEIQMMIALSPEKMAYVQVSAHKSVAPAEVKALTEKLKAGFKAL